MIIPIDDKYRIKSSAETWDIQTPAFSKKEGKYWRSIKYFHTLSAALSALYSLKVRASDVEGLDECIKEADRIFKEMAAGLNRDDFLLEDK